MKYRFEFEVEISEPRTSKGPAEGGTDMWRSEIISLMESQLCKAEEKVKEMVEGKYLIYKAPVNPVSFQEPQDVHVTVKTLRIR